MQTDLMRIYVKTKRLSVTTEHSSHFRRTDNAERGITVSIVIDEDSENKPHLDVNVEYHFVVTATNYT